MVEVDQVDNVEVLEKKIQLEGERAFHIYMISMQNKAGLCCSIFFLKGRDGEILNSTILLQYTISKRGCTEVAFDVPSHGNRKLLRRKPFYPTKKSTLQALKDETSSNSAAIDFRDVSVTAGGALGGRELGELPWLKQQLYDLKSKLKKTDDIEELLQYAKHSKERIVLEHHNVPEALWVLAKPHMTMDFSRFCTSTN